MGFYISETYLGIFQFSVSFSTECYTYLFCPVLCKYYKDLHKFFGVLQISTLLKYSSFPVTVLSSLFQAHSYDKLVICSASMVLISPLCLSFPLCPPPTQRNWSNYFCLAFETCFADQKSSLSLWALLCFVKKTHKITKNGL